jgi:hypothetical protein
VEVDLIGVLTVVVGFSSLLLGTRAVFTTFILANLLGAAAAFQTSSVTIQPPHLLLAFVAVSVFSDRLLSTASINALRFPKPGYWLACLAIYGLLSAVFLPRIFAGSTLIIPLGSSEYGNTGSPVPLGPVSSNFTQSVYIMADLLCFLFTAGFASTEEGFNASAFALLLFAAGNIFFALIDLATFYTGTQSILAFIRNAQYTLHNEDELNGLKRIVGSFTEASAFARASLGTLAFTGTLWLSARRPVLTGALAMITFGLIILSTSSSGLAGTPFVLALLYVTAIVRNGVRPDRPYENAAILSAPLLIGSVIAAVLLDEKTSRIISDHFDLLIFSKSGSDSGIERVSWNVQAMLNFSDSDGFGVGLGTVRTSGLLAALLSNVGLLGFLFYLLFVVTAFGKKRGVARSFPSDMRMAARNACIGLTVGDLSVAPTVEQGLLFYVFAGVACADFEQKEGEPR